MLRVSPQKLNVLRKLIRDRKAATLPSPLLKAGSKDDKFRIARPRGRKRSVLNAKKLAEEVRLVQAYKRAGYDISGSTSDGVIIVEPSGRPDSFNLRQLNKAVSRVQNR
ncbi:hypothetical protein ACU4GH_15555 [Bradyrhizobium betae]